MFGFAHLHLFGRDVYTLVCIDDTIVQWIHVHA
jgi:hypothetical protein